jgi:hypothetical protein
MQQAMLKTIRNRWAGVCGIAVLAACASSASAAPQASGDPGSSVIGPIGEQRLAIPAEAAQAIADAAPVVIVAAPAQAAPAADFGPAADLGKLEQYRGGTDTYNTTNNTQLNGMVTNNTATNVVTGNNTIDAGSFANMSGIPTVIQNTGANVLIQNSTTVNLQFK